jgi:hypothetical protein
VVLKNGYKWMSSDAKTLAQRGNSVLPIEWMLTFEGDGGQGKARLKIKRERRARTRRNAGA